MGDYLSKPVTDKKSSDEANDVLICGASSMHGWRIYQEDGHNCILNYDDGGSLFGVYDSHCGMEVAEYASHKLPDFIKDSEAYRSGDYEKALKEGFLKFDAMLKEPKVVEILREIRMIRREEQSRRTNRYREYEDRDIEDDDPEEDYDKTDEFGKERKKTRRKDKQEYRKEKEQEILPGFDSGCTAVVALVKDNKIYVANVGDSICIVSKGGKAVEMSIHHSPCNESEFNRIKKAGGTVSSGRVNGNLNLSRALGDHKYKQVPGLPAEDQMMSALPDVKMINLDPNIEFIFLSCDGITDTMQNEDIINFVRPRLISGMKPTSKICEELFDSCLSKYSNSTGCDNMTAIIAAFKNSNLFPPNKLNGQQKGLKIPGGISTSNLSLRDGHNKSVVMNQTEENVQFNMLYRAWSPTAALQMISSFVFKRTLPVTRFTSMPKILPSTLFSNLFCARTVRVHVSQPRIYR